MNTICRENSLLASFLYADDVGSDKSKSFIINSNIFTSPFRAAVANKINGETNSDKMYGYLFVTLKDSTSGSAYEQEWIDIEAQSIFPLEQVLKIHNDLKKEYMKRKAGF